MKCKDCKKEIEALANYHSYKWCRLCYNKYMVEYYKNNFSTYGPVKNNRWKIIWKDLTE